MNPVQALKDLSHPNKERREEAYQKVREYLVSIDPDVDPYFQQFFRKVSAYEGKLARELTKLAVNVIEGPEIKHEAELRSLADFRLKEKELNEAFAFYKKVSPLFPSLDYVVDLCCGNGLNGMLWVLQGNAKKAVSIDREENPNFERVRRRILECGNLNQESIVFYQKDIYEPLPILTGKGLIISIHACGELTDKVIDSSIGHSLPFAVMPCCHDYENKSDYIIPQILRYFDIGIAIDIMRAIHIHQAGYDIILRRISEKITEKNLILIGKPR
ncbi:hypothetical protein D6745_02375 [Candidatus Woesearchaeota archaeon]|nr:MAG: hypothetical protein D6745_02375 [Candidatus Woesearchaeota archaeon]